MQEHGLDLHVHATFVEYDIIHGNYLFFYVLHNTHLQR